MSDHDYPVGHPMNPSPAEAAPAAPKKFGLAGFDTKTGANEGRWLELILPNGEAALQENGRPVRLKVLGKDSDQFIAAENKVGNRRLAAGQRLKMTMEGFKSDTLKNLAALVIEYDGIGWPENPNPACTIENTLELFRGFPDIKDQVDDFAGDRSNFSKGSPTS